MQQPPMQPPQIRPGSEVHPELNEKKFKFFSGLNILIALASISVQVLYIKTFFHDKTISV